MKTIGASFKAAREEQGLTVDEVSKTTKISRAIINDIENEKFEKYRRDELYVKNYIKRLAAFYNLNEKELIDSYLDITHEISLSEIKKTNLEKEKKASQEQENTFTTNLNDTLTDLKKVSSIRKKNRSKRVYRNNHLRDNIRYLIVFVLVVVAILAIFWGINTFTSQSSDSDFDDVAAPVVTNNPDGTEDTDSSSDPEQENPSDIIETPAAPQVEYVKNGALNYTVSLPEDVQTFTFKVVFVGRTWAALDVNGATYGDFAQIIYNNDNADNDLQDEGEVVEITFDVAEFDNLDLTIGYNNGHRFYVNDVELAVDASDYNNTVSHFVMNLEK